MTAFIVPESVLAGLTADPVRPWPTQVPLTAYRIQAPGQDPKVIRQGFCSRIPDSVKLIAVTFCTCPLSTVSVQLVYGVGARYIAGSANCHWVRNFGGLAHCYHKCYHRCQEVLAMAALNIRNLDETVKRRLQVRAARHGRSMEAEVRAIVEEAVREPADSAGLFTALLDRFGALGGVDLDLPGRDEPARAADFSA